MPEPLDGVVDDAVWRQIPDLDPGATPQVPRRRPVKGTVGWKGTKRAKKDEQHVRQNRALELRMAGASAQQIAEILDYPSPSAAAHGAVQALRREDARLADSREQVRSLQLARLERIIRAIWPNVIAGDLFAIDRALKIFERQARLLGLDAPTQVTLTDETKTDLMRMVAQLEASLVPGEVVVDGGVTTAGGDQGADQPGDRRAGGEGADGGDHLAVGPGGEGPLAALPVAGPAERGPDDGHLADVGGPGDR